MKEGIYRLMGSDLSYCVSKVEDKFIFCNTKTYKPFLISESDVKSIKNFLMNFEFVEQSV